MTDQCAKISLAGESCRGLVRSRNEDSFCFVMRPGDNAALALVADGIGGHRDGDMASYICCHEFLMAWQARVQRELSVPGAELFLKKNVQRINSMIFGRNRFERGRPPMGSTIAAVIFLPGKVVVCHAGDSRVYMSLPGRELAMLTRDHTLVRLLEDQRLNASALRAGVQADSTIFQAVGPSRKLEPEVHVFDRPANARYLIFSDGLSRCVKNEVISRCMECNNTARYAVNLLIREALLAGAPDNVAVICGFPQE